MKHARPDYDRFQDPAGKIPADEPVFLLRGQDNFAHIAVRHYSFMAAQAGAHDIAESALRHADEMQAWAKKIPDMPAPVEPDASHASIETVASMVRDAGGTVDSAGILPDRSGFMTASFPLPEDHWLYASDTDYGSAGAPPMPLRMGTDHPQRKAMNEYVRNAARYAVRAATMCGKEDDFDPDALVQNMIVGLLGYHTPDGLSEDHDANPKLVPPVATIKLSA